MSRLRMLVAVLGATAAALGTTAAAIGTAEASPRATETILAGSAVPFTSYSRSTGDVAGTMRLTIEVWLKPDLAAAERYATAVSTPDSPLFRHYLSPAAYTARFGASRGPAARVESWLRSEGFTTITTDSGRSYVQGTAPVSRINAAFGVRLQTYRASASVNADGYPLHANNRAVSLPVSLAGQVLAVTGLDNAAPILPLEMGPATGQSDRPYGASAPCSHYYGQHVGTGLPEQFGVTSFPTFVCGYSAGQIRSAYGASWAATGKGQTIALVEVGLTRDMFLTLQDYAKANHMPAPSPERYAQLSLGNDTCGDPFDIEEQLDVESSYDMAPDAHQLVVGGDSCDAQEDGNQATYNADIAILDGDGYHPLATVASNSWETGTESQPLSQTKLVHSYLVRAASEGVGMYFSAQLATAPASSSRRSTRTRSQSAAPRSVSARHATGCSRPAGPPGSPSSRRTRGCSRAKTALRAAVLAPTGPSLPTRRGWCRSQWARPAARRTSPPTPTRSPGSTWAC